MSLILDKRDKNEIFRHLLGLAPYYIPEWSASAENDLGMALLAVFSEMFEETLAGFNKMPYKNFIYFLNLLGAEMLPSSPAEGYLTVSGASGRMLHIRKGTRAYSTDADGEKVMFALLDELTVIDNRIAGIFCKSGNVIVSGGTSNSEIKLFDFFSGQNLQKQSLILSSEHVLNIKGQALVSVAIINGEKPFAEDKTAGALCDPFICQWQYLAGNSWISVATVACVGNKLDIYIDGEIPLAEFNCIEGRWLRCVIGGDASAEICLTDIRLSARANVKPDCLYNNDTHLPDVNFFPFSERLGRFDSFYIGCEEAFAKRSAHVTIEFSLVFMKISAAPDMKREIDWKPLLSASELNEPDEAGIYIEDVAWEYWNGNGWVRLFRGGEHGSAFRGGAKEVIEFECPEDMEPTFIGGSRSCFIRARIQSHNSIFSFNSHYISPVVEDISISYRYRNDGSPVDYLFAEKDLCLAKADRLTEITANGEIEKNPVTYFALESPIPNGMFTLYFRSHAELEPLPPVKFEYYGMVNGERGWHELIAVDETKSFSVSGLITFMCGGSSERHTLFALDKYWLRAVNTDNGYEKQEIMRPRFMGIYFNTVKIEQSEARAAEYFSIEYGEAYKAVRLSGGNIVNEEVWVNEASETPEYELADGGSPEKWVKWSRAERLGCKGPGDRAYVVDPIEGVITFGNGKKGKIPPSGGGETIRVEYSLCAGSSGNIDTGKIEGFADSVPFISQIFNAVPTSGGCDAESAEEAVSRWSEYIGHLDRAVSVSDFEITAASDTNVAKAKALITENGVEIAVLPRNVNSMSFPALKKRLMTVFERKAPAVLIGAGRISVSEVSYIELSLRLQVAVDDLRHYSAARAELEKRLRDFFEPVTGNFNGRGFEIGELPTKAQIVNYLKDTSIARIVRLDIFCRERINGALKETDYKKAARNLRAVPVSGEHKIIITE